MNDLVKKVMIHNTLSSEEWKRKYDELMDVCEFLLPKVKDAYNSKSNGNSKHFIRVFFMLNAYAFENILKAVLINQNYEEVSFWLRKNFSLPGKIKGHDLQELWDKVNGLDLTDDEKNMLNRLSRESVWNARYPTPILYDDIKLYDASWEKGDGIIAEMYTSFDLRILASIHAKAIQMFEGVMKASEAVLKEVKS